MGFLASLPELTFLLFFIHVLHVFVHHFTDDKITFLANICGAAFDLAS